MSIPNNNGTPPTVRAWNDSRASRRAAHPAPRAPYDPLRLFVRVGVVFVLVLVLAALVSPAGAAGRPPRPCVGVVVRVAEGVEYVRRRDGSACTRPAARVVRRAR